MTLSPWPRWQTTVIAGRGTLTVAISLCALEGLGTFGYVNFYIAISSWFDKVGARALP